MAFIPTNNGATLNLPFDEKKLSELMWTPLKECECFVAKNGAIQVRTIPTEQSPKLFKTFKNAPDAWVKNWNYHASQISGHLLGLTTFEFTESPRERIVQTRIMVLDSGRPWHLWHEYTHYLIGLVRVQSPSLNLEPIQQTTIDKLWANVAKTDDQFPQSFQSYSRQQMDFLQKAFVDEVVIESTIYRLSTQAVGLLDVNQHDFEDSQEVMAYFVYLLDQEIERINNRFLKQNWSDLQRQKISDFQVELKKYQKTVHDLLPKAY